MWEQRFEKSRLKVKENLYVKFYKPIAKLIYPPCKTVVKEELTDEAAVYLCNHSAANGPAIMSMYFKKPHKTWMISYAMDKKRGPNYFFHDGFFGRSRKCKWFFRLLSKIVMPLLRPLLKMGDPILVYHDRRIMDTFHQSLDTLSEGKSLLIFPESPVKYSEFVHKIYDGFADIGRMFFTETGKLLKFYPVYAERQNRMINIGKPITFDPTVPAREQRKTIAEYIQTSIDALARELPPHKPVPFLPDIWYKYYGEYEHDVASYWKLFESTYSE